MYRKIRGILWHFYSIKVKKHTAYLWYFYSMKIKNIPHICSIFTALLQLKIDKKDPYNCIPAKYRNYAAYNFFINIIHCHYYF